MFVRSQSLHVSTVLIFCQLVLIWPNLYAQSPGLNPNLDRSPRSEIDRPDADSLQQPPLKFESLRIRDASIVTGEGLDSMVDYVHHVEPYSYREHILPNLGSEQSASFIPFIGSFQPYYFGVNSYDGLLDRTNRDDLVATNRSFWRIHYGNGRAQLSNILRSSHVNTSFYRSFSDGVHFNFDYQSYSDEGIDNIANNTFEQLNLKFFRKGKAQELSYISYSAPRINEAVNSSPRGTGATILTSRGNTNFTLGHLRTLKDTVGEQQKLTWHSRLQYNIDSYSASSSVYNESIQRVALLAISDSLSYHLRAKSYIWDNELRLQGPTGAWYASGQLQRTVANHGSALKAKRGFLVLRGGREAKISDRWSYNAHAGVGVFRNFLYINGRIQHDSKDVLLTGDLLWSRYRAPESTRFIVANNVTLQSQEHDLLSGYQARLNLSYLPWRLKLYTEMTSVTNYVMPDVTGLYSTIDEALSVARIRIEKLWDLWIFRSHHAVELATSNDTRITIPRWSYTGNVHIPWWIFKKRMLTHWGVDLRAVSSFDVPSYYTVGGSFYNFDSTTESGDVVMVSPYLNAQVGAFSFFVKWQNALEILDVSSQGVVLSPRELADGYPVYDQRIRFGLRWRLLD